MIETTDRQTTIQRLKGKLVAAYEYLLNHKDTENVAKVKQLAGKLVDEEFAIAFCGHFSAGKSRMINRLVGENLLPSSPIPTSANLVKVKAGEEYAKVVFKNEKPRLYRAPYDYTMVKNYCKDGDQIQEIEISHDDIDLPLKTVIMDTPGIDSADDAHRIATESAIHLADLIFYVMDYNHVQSELNFMFTKELTQAGKEVYLVINQVDKHSENELSFADFKSSVVESFASWGVKPAHIFYTSLKEDAHKHNEFPALQEFLADRLAKKDTLLLQSLLHSLQKILKDHMDIAKKKGEQELQPLKNILSELSAEEYEKLADNYHRLSEEKAALGGGIEKADKAFELEVKRILDNAYLMPFETRALAEAYLASCQSEFKVGFLFTKQKTLTERQKRLDCFYEEILEKTKSQLEWHLRNFLATFLKENRVERKDLLEEIQSFHVDFARDLLTAAVKPGARLSDTMVINYTADVANEIKRLAKSDLAAIKAEILTALQEKNAAIEARIAEKLAGVERYINAFEAVEKAALSDQRKRARLEALIDEAEAIEDQNCPLFQRSQEAVEVIEGQTGQVKKVQKKVALPQNQLREEKPVLPVRQTTDRMKQTAEKLKKTVQLVQDLPGFQKLASELGEKAQRLDNKGFTVALFGAFSAGKSSFANALIGESVLPVSPNPMTAAINRIKPVNAACGHGTVMIKLKAEAAMLDDVNHALRLFDFHAVSLEDAAAIVGKLSDDLGTQGAAEKTNYTFLRAFKRGYSVFNGQLGNVLKSVIADFGDYVAKEEKSCFVEWIDLYYDCPLTRKNITLVDTPGADSINARHTGVAFDFIKNSDAILFVTYYNHAFSKADREFLIQLGRVKDSFELDKMFFIINAIDLAENEEEKDAVSLYVQEQLIKYGVRNPHLYALSSLHALKEKQADIDLPSSGMIAFEDSFYHFITNDLANMAAKASEHELKRVYHLVEKLMDSMNEDAVVKQKKRENMKAEKLAIHDVFARHTPENLKNRINQETEELIYYTKQRVFLRFNDFFKESFNPTVLRDDGRNLKKVLHNSLSELLGQIGFDFAQEMRATTVRLDRFAKKITAEYQRLLVETICEINQDLSFSSLEFEAKGQIEFEAAFQDMPRELFTKAMHYFKNPKAFFEDNESKFMGEEIYRILNIAADDYLQKEQTRIQSLYDEVIEAEFEKLIEQMKQQVDDLYLSLISALDGGVPAAQLAEIKTNLMKII